MYFRLVGCQMGKVDADSFFNITIMHNVLITLRFTGEDHFNFICRQIQFVGKYFEFTWIVKEPSAVEGIF